MSHTTAIRTALPGDCSASESERFFDLVVEGEEVGGGVLRTNIAEARILVMLIVDGFICGIAALKRPRKSYRDKISIKSGINLDEAVLPYELGYVYVQPSFQGQGHSHRLIKAALAHSDGVGVFATVRMDNDRMRATLEKAGFVATGRSYPGRNMKPIGALLRLPA